MGSVRELIEVAKASSEGYAETLEPDGDWAPMLFIDTASGMTIALIDPQFLDDKDRLWGVLIPNLIGEIAKGVAPEAVVLLASSWMVEYDPDDPELGDAFDAAPSEHPRRTECLVLVGVSSQAEAGAMATIVRGGPHPVLEWSPEAEAADVTFAGEAMAGMRQAVWG